MHVAYFCEEKSRFNFHRKFHEIEPREIVLFLRVSQPDTRGSIFDK